MNLLDQLPPSPSPPSSSSPPLPSSFDPAVHLHSEHLSGPPLIVPSNNNSDDLEALHLQHHETTTAKNSRQVVIQHRAWGVAEAFRSEEVHPVVSPLQERHNLPISSSPPQFKLKMPLISSPVAYPPSSSPMPTSKKRKVDDMKEGILGRKKVRAGFVEAESDEDDMLIEPTTTTGATVKPQYPGPLLSEAPTRPGDSLPDLPLQSYWPPPLNASQLSQSSQPKTKQYAIRTCSGARFTAATLAKSNAQSFEQLVAARSATIAGRAKKSCYGIDIHALLDEANRGKEAPRDVDPLPSIEPPHPTAHPGGQAANKGRTLMWTEKYRARKFTDLVGDERTHRSVLRWLKGWDPIVFPGSAAARTKATRSADDHGNNPNEERAHRKILLLTGPPGLGKTTLAHVCARQAGYEVLEINASDERSRDVVRGRIRDCVGTENVRGVAVKHSNGKSVRKAGRPVCVVVDEVDGVVSGANAGGGEGGFIRALIDLVLLDQKNSAGRTTAGGVRTGAKKKRGDNFRLLRPLILICNDVYHPALRPLRQSSFAEVIHIRKAALNSIVARMKTIFDREKVECEVEGVRRLCEGAWGVSSRRDGGGRGSGGTGEGDIRGVLVVGEWAAGKLRSSALSNMGTTARLTRKWVEQHILGSLSHDGGAARGLGRGGTREIVERVFLEGAGFPRTAEPGPSLLEHRPGLSKPANLGVAELSKRRAVDRLREMVDTSGESDRIVTDCFAHYPLQPYQDDTLLSKPDLASSHLHFHDQLSHRVFAQQEWELSPYLSLPILAMHQLFSCPASASAASAGSAWSSTGKRVDHSDPSATSSDPPAFSTPLADHEAREAEKHALATLSTLQSHLSLPLHRAFRSPASLATDLLPYLVRILAPAVHPVVVAGVASVRKGSERAMVQRAVGVMAGVGVTFERGRVEDANANANVTASGNSGWVYRMEPPLDVLSTFETSTGAAAAAAAVGPRYAIRQVLEQELAKEGIRRENEARAARYRAGGEEGEMDADLMGGRGKENVAVSGDAKGHMAGGRKRDFFGRVVVTECVGVASDPPQEGKMRKREDEGGENKVWITFHEGFSNAVRKPITLGELMAGL